MAGDQDAAATAGDHVRLAAALAESELRFRAVTASLEEGVTLHDAEGRIVAANASAARILAVPVAALLGLSLTAPEWASVDSTSAPVPPEQHPITLATATGKPAPVALVRIKDRGGELRWLQMKVTPTGEGGAVRAVCLFADITFARREEENRQRTDVNFRTLIERTPDAMAVYQHDPALGHDPLCYVNPRMISLLGYERVNEMRGRPVGDFVFPEDRVLVERRMLFASTGGGSLETPMTEARLLRRDGAPVPVEVNIIPITFYGEPATLMHARDLTERKRLEAQVVLTDRLASLGRLTAAVGHEINNPLAYVMANLDLALERLAEPDGGEPDRLADLAEMLRDARDGADRVRRLVRDLKVFSRGETEERTRVDPSRVLESCVSMAGAEIRQRARLVKRYVPTPSVLANEARLGQVLLNLLINATHAIPLGEHDAHEIQVGTFSDEQGRVVIEVRDSGAGIPDDAKPHIFEPFFTTKAGGRGTGLGLSICRSIVTALGGEIGFESQLGRGTSFRVILPPAPLGSEPPGPI